MIGREYPWFRPSSWGRYPATRARAIPVFDRWSAALPEADGTMLPYGNGRSYGDVALNDGENLLLAKGLDRFITFDAGAGILSCEAGVMLEQILDLIVPRGWFIPVTPGTRFVTVGGAIANDVHGKNHHCRGSFGNHVRRLRLLRSDRGALECSPESNSELFAATIGGLGLTGLIVSAEMQLLPVPGAYLHTETFRFSGLSEFLEISAESERYWEYAVAWVDCLAKGRRAVRGVFYRARHAEHAPPRAYEPKNRPAIPGVPPFSLVNNLTSRLFNELYYRAAPLRASARTQHYAPYFYPLDAWPGWNSLYGPRGFLQHQSVIPPERVDALKELLATISREGQGSFLAVLKVFGNIASAGMLSFPRPGITLALDLPLQGTRTFEFLDRVDRIVSDAGGAVYPAKDARMSPRTFERGFPRIREFERHRDPKFDSSFWRCVRGTSAA
jgi:FAD/FMN-containing dehydrogenase